MELRLRAVCDLMVPTAREGAGLHDYDGAVQDLSPEGVAAGLARLGGRRRYEALDDAHLAAFEDGLRAWFGEAEAHRWNPYVHLDNLDLAVYDKEYAPAEERRAARRRHLAAWPDAVDGALAALDRVPRPVADALLPATRGLAHGLDPDEPVEAAALAAHRRLVDHVAAAAGSGDPDAGGLGGSVLARVLGAGEAMVVDLGRLAERAEAERARLLALLDDACDRLRPGIPRGEVVAGLLADHPGADEVLDEARAATAAALAFTAERGLVADVDGECLVGPAPPSRRWAMAMLTWAAPYEPDGPSWYHVTPPDPAWPRQEQEQWLAVFSRATLPAVTVHEVAPGHFTHGRALRRVRSDVARALHSPAFVEGWAHYAEELCLEEGFLDGDPSFAVGVALEALVRVTRLSVSIGVHSGAMSPDEAVARFTADAYLAGPAARSEAARATFDPTYGRYTWGKLEVLSLRDEAQARWGRRYSHRRFHDALLALGAPPLGLLDAAFD